MAFENYAALQATAADFLNRKDLTAAIPGFISLAEAQMMRSFVQRDREGIPIPRRLIQRSDAPLSVGQEYIAVPTDFVGPKTLFLSTSYGPREVTYLDYEVFQVEKTRWRHASVTSNEPRHYTVVGSELQFFPPADAAYPAELTYIARFAKLSDTAPSNWILADHPDAYLYGTLLQSAPYLKDDARLTVWTELFQNAVNGICMADPKPAHRGKLRTDIRVGRLHYPGYYNPTTDC